jgi:hypothetical protein
MEHTKYPPPKIVFPPKQSLAAHLRGILHVILCLISSCFGLAIVHFPAMVLIRPFSEWLWKKYTEVTINTW